MGQKIESKRRRLVPTRVTGPFDVKLTPQPMVHNGEGALARMSIDKQYHGALDGTGKGEMLSAGTSVKGSAAYVAVERVTGSLNGRSGTFVLQHAAVMTRGQPSLRIAVVPDSGTDQLVGISGTMAITITDGKHFYELDYELAHVS
jgi:hypothetical protein